MNSKKVSVIVPVYNKAGVIVDNVNSILEQDYTNIEIIVVNDGSTDETNEILQTNFHDIDNVKIVTQENQGVGAARNRGLKEATGDYILYMDGDDMFINDSAISKLASKMDKEKLDWLSFGFAYIKKSGIQLKKSVGVDIYSIYSGVWNKMYDRNLIKDLQFPDSLRFEDMIFTIEAYMKSQKKGNLDEPLYGYVQRPGSITKDIWDGTERRDALVVLQETLDGEFGKNEMLRRYVNFHFITHLMLAVQESGFKNEKLIDEFLGFHQRNGLNMNFNNNILKKIIYFVYYYLVKMRFRGLALKTSNLAVTLRGKWRNEED